LVAKAASLISPYRGALVDLLVPPEAHEELKARASRYPSVQLSDRAVCDLELLATGAFSPLERFMGQEDYRRVVDEMRLQSGDVFPIPVTLPVDVGTGLHLDQEVALRNAKNDLLAIMTVEEIYAWDYAQVSQQVFGTQDGRHPLVKEMQRWGRLNISGRLQVLQLPRHYDFQDLRLTPTQTRASLEACGYKNVVGFQTRNPLHRVHGSLSLAMSIITPVSVPIKRSPLATMMPTVLCWPCYRSPCGLPDHARPCGMRSSGAIMAPTI
jgi:sulfate adenylyltransferase